MAARKIGLISPFGEARFAANLAHEAECGGWDGFFVGEAVWHNDAWAALTAAAMRTERIRLGTMLSPMPVMKPWKLVYGGLGLIGLRLTRKLGLPDIWDAAVLNRGRFIVPALSGLGLGSVFIIADLIFSPVNGIGRLPHPPLVTAIVASIAAGIGEEIMFRLFFISFWTWLIGMAMLKCLIFLVPVLAHIHKRSDRYARSEAFLNELMPIQLPQNHI